ncbi:MAG: TolC family protein [Gemmatimonadaceae bacterium]
MTPRPLAHLLVVLVAVAVAPAGAAVGQPRQPTITADTLHLGALQAEAVSRDPRAGQLELLGEQSDLRLRGFDAERLPTVGLDARGQYQSDVVEIPFRLPGGGSEDPPPHDSYDAHLAARQPLYDPTREPRRDVERSRLAEARARVRSSLFALRERVSESYFAALLLQARRAELQAGIADLEARLAVARDRVRLGSALPSEADLVEAELLTRRQAVAELDADRHAALVVLGQLTGRTVTDGAALALPDPGPDVARARVALDQLRERPEYEQFSLSRDALGAQSAAVAAGDRPRVSAFGRAGYGRPGLNPLARDFDRYWLAGVQVEWTPWNWGSTGRRREELRLQQRIVESEEAAFAEGIARGVVADLATMDRLAATVQSDDAIVELRERIVGEARLRLDEGVIGSAEYVDRETDMLAARLARATHRVELARAGARFLTLVGLEVR